jgi:hypothetical protein
MAAARWTYRIVRLEVKGATKARIDLAAAEAELDQLGADGWELVSAVAGSESGSVLCVFKRPT